MREWCGCGAAIRASRRHVIQWRTQHHCPNKHDTEPDGIVQLNGAQIEHGAHYISDGLEARIGFQRE